MFRGSCLNRYIFCLYLSHPPGRAKTKPRLAPRTGNLTPPRISPSCPHCVNKLWLDRGFRRTGLCETACHRRFWVDGPALHLVWPSLTKNQRKHSLRFPQVVFAHLPHRSRIRFCCFVRIFSFQGSRRRNAVSVSLPFRVVRGSFLEAPSFPPHLNGAYTRCPVPYFFRFLHVFSKSASFCSEHCGLHEALFQTHLQHCKHYFQRDGQPLTGLHVVTQILT